MSKSKKVSRERISFRHELRDQSWLRTGLQCPSPKAGIEATGEGYDWLLTGLQCPIRKEGE